MQDLKDLALDTGEFGGLPIANTKIIQGINMTRSIVILTSSFSRLFSFFGSIALAMEILTCIIL